MTKLLKLNNGNISAFNDGSGSDLDADLLDGLHSTSFVRTDANSDIPYANLSFGSATRQMINLWDTIYGIGVQDFTTYIRSSTNIAFYLGGSHADSALTAGGSGVCPYYVNNTGGFYPANTQINLGANTTYGATLRVGGNGYTAANSNTIASVVTTNGNLHLDAGGDKITYVNYYSGTGGVYFGSGASGTVATISNTGVYTQLSDRRSKEKIKPTNYGLKEILQLKPVTYNWKNDNNKVKHVELGLIAQEVQDVIPEVVSTIKQEEASEDLLGLDYAKLVPVLINSIKELKLEIDSLKKQIK